MGAGRAPQQGAWWPGPPWAPPADLPQQLGHDLDLLAAAEQVAEGHAGDARHLHGIHQHHEALQQPQGQEGVLEAVYTARRRRVWSFPFWGRGQALGDREATAWEEGGKKGTA